MHRYIKLRVRYAMAQGALMVCLGYILFTACGPLIDSSVRFNTGGDVQVEPAFLQYVGDFEAEYGQRIRGISMMFDRDGEIDEMAGGVVAFCQPALRRIIVDPQWFWGDSDWRREIFLFHELGHCILQRGHRSRMMSNVHIPVSLMHPSPGTGLDRETYKKYRTYYMRELFGRTKK